MKIPQHWSRALGSADDPEGKRYALKIWGSSEDSLAEAAALAKRRLADATSRVARGMIGKDAYFYGKTPLREQVVRVIGGESDQPSEAAAVVTRNRYGALVLNTASVPFVDVDVPDPSDAGGESGGGDGGGGLLGLFGFGGKKAKTDRFSSALERVRAACVRHASTSFRVYRTRGGFRLLATDLLLDPTAASTESLLNTFGADPFFVKLCRLQASFRARLTPKPWRVGCRVPPSSYPFESPAASAAFDEWLEQYSSASASKATCSLVEVVGSGRTLPEAAPIVAEHDRACKVGESLPLA